MSDVWASTERPRGRRLAFDLLVTSVFVILAILASNPGDRPTALVATLLIGVALLIRHRWRWLAVGLALVAGITQVVASDALVPFADLGYAPICYLLGASRSLTTRRIGLGLSAFAIVSAGVRAWLSPEVFAMGDEGGRNAYAGVIFAVLAAAVTLGGWVAGYLQLQTRRSVQAQVDAEFQAVERRRATEALQQEQERAHIAADMHDVVAHAWAVVAAQADGARYLLRTDPDQAARALAVIGDTARGTIGDLRTILQQLKHQESSGALPGHAQQDVLCDRMRASGMTLDVATEGEPVGDALLSLTAYRLLSECLTNALKHGDLSRPVIVRQDWRDGYRLSVRNRIGVPGDALGTGQGIAGMSERALVAGGLLNARREGEDWLVEAHLPLPPHAHTPEEPT